MPFELKNSVATIEKPTDTTLADMVDKKMEQNAVVSQAISEVERETERFDMSHTAHNLTQVYNEIDRETVAQVREETPTVTQNATPDDTVARLKKSKTYQDVVQTFETPTLEINEIQVSKKAKNATKQHGKLSNRMKLWITTGACCLCLLVGLVVCNALSIGEIERQTAMTEATLAQQEAVLDNVNGQISAESGRIPENMRDTVQNGGTIDVSPTVSPDIVTSNNFFNRLSKFISYLFGR